MPSVDMLGLIALFRHLSIFPFSGGTQIETKRKSERREGGVV